MKYTVFSTELGWVGCAQSGNGACAITLPQDSRQKAVDALGVDRVDPVRDLAGLAGKLLDYFGGGRPAFDCALDYGEATAFQRSVWEATRTIPYGETRSYSWVARAIGKPAAARAVGQALGRNPLAIVVPCHRVLGNDGGLCGFGGGLEIKKRLLELEGAKS